MSIAPGIRYLQRTDIDDAKWNACIDAAPNGLIYAQTWYLDALCDHWDALVKDDYTAVMPLPWRSKWGIRYVFQQPFIQRLHVFGNAVTEDISAVFIQQAAEHFSYIHFNIGQPYRLATAGHLLTNYTINLHTSYQAIKAQYTAQCKDNIEKAKRRGCALWHNDVGIEQVLQLYKKAYGYLQHHICEKDYAALALLARQGLEKGFAQVYAVRDADGNLIYAALILKDNRRLYYLLGAPTEAGRQKRATYFFIDQLLQLHAGKPLLFDFEGSDIPSVATFYQRFGPEAEHYFNVKISNLPWWLHWLKA